MGEPVEIGRCQSCGSEVRWVRTRAGKMLVDPDPHPDGNVRLINGRAALIPYEAARRLRDEGEAMYRAHYWTCGRV